MHRPSYKLLFLNDYITLKSQSEIIQAKSTYLCKELHSSHRKNKLNTIEKETEATMTWPAGSCIHEQQGRTY